jgi:hypothetical protein
MVIEYKNVLTAGILGQVFIEKILCAIALYFAFYATSQKIKKQTQNLICTN